MPYPLVHAFACLTLLLGADVPPKSGPYFTITVVDEQTGRGVPLIELETVHHVKYVTDSNGVVAFDEPGLMGQTVFFHVRGHGYEYPRDGFGFRGKALAVRPGGDARLAVRRVNVAERIYRVTGGGIYRDSLLVGRAVPLRRPALNGLVFGSDSAVTATFRGKLYWFWGDTNRPGYPLGNYHVPGATSELPGKGGLDPERGVDLTYFLDENGFAKPTAPMPGPGPTWIDGLVTLRESQGRERLFAAYAKIRGALEVYERGLVEFDPERCRFEKVVPFPKDAPARPGGHPFHHTAGGVDYVYFATPYPLTRVRAEPECLKDLAEYESFTCLKGGGRSGDNPVERGADGLPRFAWRKNAPPLNPNRQAQLVRRGLLKPDEALWPLRDFETGQPVLAHGGSVAWNPYRRRWVMIAVQSGGRSMLGEVWYAEADTPLGPWVYARKVVTHDRYSFYNPLHHPQFDKDDGRVIFFEGTYTHTFSGNPEPTPRYDYNQIMYKLDLAGPRLILPVPVYRWPGEKGVPDRLGTLQRPEKKRGDKAVAFFALDRPAKGAVPVYGRAAGAKGYELRVNRTAPEPGGADAGPVFFALPADTQPPPAGTVPLYEFVQGGGGKMFYTTDASWSSAGYRRAARPVCRVWANPTRVVLPDD